MAVYSYYTSLYNAKPNQFLWAGLGKLAGGAVITNMLLEAYLLYGSQVVSGYANSVPGFLTNPSANAIASYAAGLAGLPAALLTIQEINFLTIQHKIFDDLAWQHEAYLDAGLFALTLLPTAEKSLKAKDILTEAFQDIDKGDNLHVLKGNRLIAHREQNDIVQPTYDSFNPLQGHVISVMTLSPLPGGKSFRDDQGLTANICTFPDRWAWMTSDMLPLWESTPAATRTSWVNAPLGSLYGT